LPHHASTGTAIRGHIGGICFIGFRTIKRLCCLDNYFLGEGRERERERENIKSWLSRNDIF
jgi:hypothetical protein